jgi:AraC-type DNA-binding domain-containing proteins
MIYHDAHYISGGKFVPNGTWIHPDRTIDTNEIIYAIKGTVMLAEENTEYYLKDGDCLILEKGKRHYGIKQTDEFVSFYWFHFQSDETIPREMKYVPAKGNERIGLLSKQLLHAANTAHYPKEACDCLLRLLLIELLVSSRNIGDDRLPVISNVCEWIKNNSGTPLKAASVSERFSYNADYLSRIFKTQFGIGLKDYISRERLKHIKDLLLTTDYPLKQIASLCGFEDYKCFLKFFKYHDNSTPEKFRSLYFNTHINNS